MINLDLKLTGFATTLGVTPAELEMVHQDRVNFEYIYALSNQIKADMEAFSAYREAMFKGPRGAAARSSELSERYAARSRRRRNYRTAEAF